MTNEDFQNVIEASFTAFLSCGTSRNTQKLIPLHGAIAQDMHEIEARNPYWRYRSQIRDAELLPERKQLF